MPRRRCASSSPRLPSPSARHRPRSPGAAMAGDPTGPRDQAGSPGRAWYQHPRRSRFGGAPRGVPAAPVATSGSSSALNRRGRSADSSGDGSFQCRHRPALHPRDHPLRRSGPGGCFGPNAGRGTPDSPEHHRCRARPLPGRRWLRRRRRQRGLVLRGGRLDRPSNLRARPCSAPRRHAACSRGGVAPRPPPEAQSRSRLTA